MEHDPSQIMVAPSQIAERDSVSKQAVSKALKRLLEERPETPVERGSRGEVLRLSLAHYDEFRHRFVNPAKVAASVRAIGGAGPVVPAGDSFEEARRQSEWLKVGREKIRHQEECRQLLRKDKIDEALSVIGDELLAIVKRLPNRAEDVAHAVSKEGVHGVRVLLRQIAFEIGNEMADKLEHMVEAAPETDLLIEDDRE